MNVSLKGLVCHTSLDDSNYVGPDPFFGWGLLNTREAALTITNANAVNPTTIVKELALNQAETYTFQVVVTEPKNLKASICWTSHQARNGARII